MKKKGMIAGDFDDDRQSLFVVERKAFTDLDLLAIVHLQKCAGDFTPGFRHVAYMYDGVIVTAGSLSRVGCPILWHRHVTKWNMQYK